MTEHSLDAGAVACGKDNVQPSILEGDDVRINTTDFTSTYCMRKQLVMQSLEDVGVES